MNHCLSLVTAAGLFLSALTARAQIPQMIAYQGRVAAGGVNFHGTGQFKFAIVRGNYGGAPGEPLNLWSNDGSLPSTDTTNAPAAAVSMSCDRGLYSVLLGNTAAGMVAVPPSVFANPDVRLRVWFNDGSHGWQKLTPDQRLVSVGYAMMADSATTAQTAQTVADGAITAAKLANGAVTAAKMSIGSVTSSAIANGSVTVGALADGSVTTAKLGTGSVHSASILDGTITAADIFDGTIGTADLANGAVTALKIASETITAQEVGPSAIGTSELADSSVTTAKLTPGAVGTQQIQTGAVRSTEILDGSIAASDLANSAVTAAKVAANTLTAAEIAAAAITSSELADGAVTSSKIAANAVTAGKVAAGTITSQEIATATIQNINLAYNVINTGEIIDGAVQTADVANSAITFPKLGVMPVAVCRMTGGQQYAGSPGDPECIIAWNAEDADTGNFHNAVNPTRLTVSQKGLYRFVVHAGTQYVSSTGDFTGIMLFKNGRGTDWIPANSFANNSFRNLPAGSPWTVGETVLNAGDYVEVLLYGPDAGQTVYGATLSMTMVTQLP